MRQAERHIDAYLRAIRTPTLVALAQEWGAPPSASAETALAAILAVLNDPARVQSLVRSLSDQEQTALALTSFLGSTINAEALTAVLRVLGFPCPAAPGSMLGEPLLDLARRGLLLHDSLYDPLTVSTRYGPCQLCADERLLAQGGPITVVPLPLAPCAALATNVGRAPASVTLDVLMLLRTTDDIGGLLPTNSGALRVADVRRLARALNWPTPEPAFAATPFLSAIPSLIMILWAADVLTISNGRYVASPQAGAFVEQPYVELLRALLQGGLWSRRWQEWPDPPWRDTSTDRQHQWRLVLVSALMALPAGGAFVAIDDLAEALFARLGQSFSLAGPVSRPLARYQEELSRGQPAEEAWQVRLRATWHERERRWITQALTTWLTWLGIVEVGLVGDTPTAVRLTEVGRAILQPWQPPPDAPVSNQPGWVTSRCSSTSIGLRRIFFRCSRRMQSGYRWNSTPPATD